MLVEQNTVLVEEREREIRQIVQSISDLNEIFRDLAGMVVEQVRGKRRICYYVLALSTIRAQQISVWAWLKPRSVPCNSLSFLSSLSCE